MLFCENDTDGSADAASFCDDMIQSDITLSMGQSYSSDNRFCNNAHW